MGKSLVRAERVHRIRQMTVVFDTVGLVSVKVIKSIMICSDY